MPVTIKSAVLTIIAASLFGASPLPAQRPAAVPVPPTTLSERDTRIGELIRLWYFVRMFHPALAGDARAWDDALVSTVPAVLAAPDEQAFARLTDAMLATVGGYIEPAVPARRTSAATSTPAFRLEGGAAIASCRSIGRANSPEALAGGMASVATAMQVKGLVIDCRGFAPDGSDYAVANRARNWVVGAVAPQLGSPIPSGGRRVRFHDGFPTELGITSGGYEHGTATLALQPIRPLPGAGGAPKPAQTVLLVDADGPLDWGATASLQAAGLLKVVIDGDADQTGLLRLPLRRGAAILPVADYVRADGNAGFVPDACVAPGHSGEALAIAVAMLAPGGRGPACSGVASTPRFATASKQSGPMPEGAAPPIGERVLALAKIWGAIEYFYPYRALLDRPWESELDAALPAFLAADSRAAYEDAVQRLAHAIPDTHTVVSGQRASVFGRNRWIAPLYIRPVADTFAVLGVLDPLLVDRVHVGDEIVAVDGRGAPAIAAEFGARVSASTPQSLASIAASALTAGPENSDVRLTLRRAKQAPFDITVRRSMRAGTAARPGGGEPAWRRLAPDIGYIDLERLTSADANTALDQLIDTRAIVFDLRGYPQGTAWVIAPRLALPGRDGAVAAAFRRPRYLGPEAPGATFTSFEQKLPPTTRQHYTGKVVVLIDARAISQSEHTALFFKAAANPVFVGTATTGANGDVTSLALPGNLSLRFTGHDVRYPDGRQLQRVGIQPDVRVSPTLAGIRAGRDEVLEAGMRVARVR